MKKLIGLEGCLLLILMFSLLLGSTRVSLAAGESSVMWVFDLSGSMGGFIGNCTSAAKQTTDILAPYGVCFGVISHVDYVGSFTCCGYSNTYGTSGDYPYQLNVSCTTNTGTVKSAIDGLAIGNGADLPEDYTRIMHELYSDSNISWCPGSKTAIHFGDSEAHWCNNPEGSTGCDPGRDATANTTDDLDLLVEALNMSLNGITYTFIGPDNSPGYTFWTDFASNHTGVYALSLNTTTPEQLASHIKTLLELPVGGVWVPVDKLALLAPYIALTSTILVATVATAIYVKRVKRRKKRQ